MMNPSLFGFFTVVCLILGLLGTGVYTTYFLLEYHIITFYPYFILDIFKRTRISQLYVDSPFSISISWYYPSYLCDGANIFTLSYHIDILSHVFYFRWFRFIHSFSSLGIDHWLLCFCFPWIRILLPSSMGWNLYVVLFLW